MQHGRIVGSVLGICALTAMVWGGAAAQDSAPTPTVAPGMVTPMGADATAIFAATFAAESSLAIQPIPTLDPTLLPIVPTDTVPTDSAPGMEAMPIAEATIEVIIEAPPAPTAIPLPPISLEAAEALPTLIAGRSDIELLATTAFGSIRPTGWSGSMDVNDPQLSLYLRIDLEIMVGAVLGAEVRPAGWFGVIASTPLAVARDIRHDLELLADQVMGAVTLRPAGWTGDDPLMRCGRATQSLAAVLARENYGLNIDFAQPDACAQAELEVSRFVERTIIQPPAAAIVTDGGGTRTAFDPYAVDSPFVPAFYDRKAIYRAGVVPIGTGFRPIGRSLVEFSNMMLVEGDGFTLFVDYTTTPVTFSEFSILRDVGNDATITTSCEANWCE